MKQETIGSAQYTYGSYHFMTLKEGVSHYLFLGVFFVEQEPGIFYFRDTAEPADMPADSRKAYEAKASQCLRAALQVPDISLEEIYDRLALLHREYGLTYRFPVIPAEISGLDQRAEQQALYAAHRNVLLVLTRPYLPVLAKLVRQYPEHVFHVLTKPDSEFVPTEAEIMQACCAPQVHPVSDGRNSQFPDYGLLQKPAEDLFADVYGEELFLQIKDLSIDASVTTGNADLYAKVLLNCFEHPGTSVVCVPAHWNLIRENRIVTPAFLQYRQLAYLLKKYGKKVLQESILQLYQTDPDLFYDYYTEEEPPQLGLKPPASLDDYRKEKWAYTRERIRQETGMNLEEFYVDEEGNLCHDFTLFPAEKKKRILVDRVQLSGSIEATLLHPQPGETTRHLLARQHYPAACITNFLFFMTTRLIDLYNRQRQDRVPEQIPPEVFVLDYQKENGCEYFPLYAKSGVAMIQDKGLRLTRFRLRGGTLTVAGIELTFRKEDVDPEEPGDIAVYTPLRCESPEHTTPDNWNYTLPVGQGRINLPVVGRHVICVHDGDVLLPGCGVVLSLRREYAASLGLLKKAQPCGQGYYRFAEDTYTLQLDNPSTLPDAEWQRCLWAQGGAVTLMEHGDPDYRKHMRTEGWFTRLSRQTQETALDVPDRHPRTFLTQKADGTISVYVISGRSRISEGADFSQILKIVGKLEPDAVTIINMDGGSSSVLAAVFDTVLCELNLTAPSPDTPAGMIRNIETVFVLRRKEQAS